MRCVCVDTYHFFYLGLSLVLKRDKVYRALSARAADPVSLVSVGVWSLEISVCGVWYVGET